ncbi:MBL fold metallo-hydrolase [Levilactobacillus enshiensis]|uniref:MBL fold metallo-hydrolase n=1 Tax=Levilactobacillus enshiensis TaxID=2590213 RepID=UPI00117BD6C2|nr:MBL fold metallo-hydrolase [Levilactobacillus enshiensis]
MKTKQFGHIYQLTFLPRLFPINCYLVDEGRELMLVDTGMSFCTKGILKAIKRLKKPLTRIILTHAHVDHVGSLDAVKAEFPQAWVYISTRDARILAGDLNLEALEDQTEIKGGTIQVETEPDKLLTAGDHVGSLTAYLVPGHTPGSMAFYQASSQALLAGDAFVVQGGLAVAGDKRWRFPFSAAATWSLSTAIKSAERLNQLPVQYLMVGHGKVIQRANRRMAVAIAGAKRRQGRQL